MSDCELMTVCIFSNDKVANMPSTAGMLKRKYCQGDFALCAVTSYARRWAWTKSRPT